MTRDCLVVGGGPAGLSAALILGRSRRSVLVCDAGRPRNWASLALHGFLTRDGLPPAELRRLAREEVARYGVDLMQAEVIAACRTPGGFRATLAGGAVLDARTLLIATGVMDRLPAVEGMDRYYGRGVFHCPYCDGWEARDEPLVAYGRGRAAVGLAQTLLTWSPDVTLCSDGRPGPGSGSRETLARHGIRVETERVARVEGGERLERVVFRSGRALMARALFFNTGQFQRSPLAAELGCRFNRKGTVQTNRQEGTGIEGLYVAGDASHDVQLAIVAAAEGAKAGIAIDKLLRSQDASPRPPP